jgi:hypothetical protein
MVLELLWGTRGRRMSLSTGRKVRLTVSEREGEGKRSETKKGDLWGRKGRLMI